jgi:hypothetical protein
MIYLKYTNETEGFKLWSSKFHGIMTLPLSLIGVIFNILTIAIFSQKSMRSLTNNILLGISVFDILLMVAYIPYAIYFYLLGQPDPVPGQSPFWPYYALINSHLSLFAHGCSVWFACFLALYRYLTVTSCVTRGSYNPNFNSIKIRNIMIGIVLMVLTCMTFNVLSYGIENSCFQFLEISDNSNSQQSDQHEVCVEDNNLFNGTNFTNKIVSLRLPWVQDSRLAREHPIILNINFWIHAIVFRTVPCLLLLVLSVLLIYVMRIANINRMKLMKQGRRSEYEKAGEFNRTTTMLLIVVISFLMMELPHGILYIICSIHTPFFRDVYVHLGDLLDLLVLINSSINFFLYCCMSSQFRDKFKQMFYCNIFLLDKKQQQQQQQQQKHKQSKYNSETSNINLKRFSKSDCGDGGGENRKEQISKVKYLYAIFNHKKNRKDSSIDAGNSSNQVNSSFINFNGDISNVNINDQILDKTPFIDKNNNHC